MLVLTTEGEDQQRGGSGVEALSDDAVRIVKREEEEAPPDAMVNQLL